MTNQGPRLDIAEIVSVPVLLLAMYFVVPLDGPIVFGVGVGLAAVAVATPMAVRRARRIASSPRPIQEAAQATALFATMLVVGFSTLYFVTASNTPEQIEGIHTKIDALYFTVTILSTVGFGDITADGQFARAVVSLNIVFNLVSLGVTVRLFGWAARQRISERASGSTTTPTE